MSEEQSETFEERENSELVRLCQVNDFKQVSIHMLHKYALEEVLFHLPILELINMRQVCRRWKIIINECWYKRKKLDFCQVTWSTKRSSININHVEIVLKKYMGKYLVTIDMSGPMLHVRLKKHVIYQVAKYCNVKKLKKCILTDMHVDPSSISALEDICGNFTKFDLRKIIYDGEFDELEDALCTVFKRSKHIKYCFIVEPQLSCKCLLPLPKETLHTLEIGTMNNDDIYLFEALQQFQNLKECKLILLKTSSRIFEVLAKYCKNLAILEIEDIIQEMICHEIEWLNFYSLHVLKLRMCISDDFLINLANHWQQIVVLTLRDCSNVTNIGIAAIATLPNLEILALCGDDMTDAALNHKHNLKEFHYSSLLVYCPAGINMGIISLISSSPEVQTLNLWWRQDITDDIDQIIQVVFPNRRITILCSSTD